MNKLRKMKVCIVVVGSILLTSVQHSTAVIILVHGSFARSSKWWQPGGAFFQELASYAGIDQDTIVPFVWSGSLGHEAKITAATFLAKLILSYPATEQITLVGHSHGGNVINLASNLIYRAASMIPDAKDNADLSNQQSLISYVGRSMSAMLKSNLYNEEKQSALFLTLLQAYHEVASFYREHTNRAIVRIDNGVTTEKESIVDEYEKPSFLIERIYLLGTPVDAKSYAPNMNVVRSVYNLYSKGDRIQRVFGFYKRQYRGLERVTNFRMLFQTALGKHSYYNPSHNETHDALVGMWLLSIPQVFKDNTQGDLMIKDGSIKFHRNEGPLYEPRGT